MATKQIHKPTYNPLTCVPLCGHAWNPRRQALYVAIGKLREAKRRLYPPIRTVRQYVSPAIRTSPGSVAGAGEKYTRMRPRAERVPGLGRKPSS